ncbi:MAG: permease [Deltaproteobacteria bacterium]|nr:MAG: permease [Deltaproteobacteria bacterium]
MALGSLGARVQPLPGSAAVASPDVRVRFIRKTYLHLAAAIALFTALEYLFVTSEAGRSFTAWAVGGRGHWLVVLGAFMAAGWLADRWARSNVSATAQYVGLLLYVVAEVVIMCPLLYVVAIVAKQPNTIAMAGVMTLMLFAGLTATVFITKKDFSFLRGAITVGGFCALGLIVASMLFGFHLGLLFSFAMIALAAAAILYDTSQVMRHYRPTQHVAASLALFASVALMFYYVLMFLMQLQRD